jgi:hypothetical protein
MNNAATISDEKDRHYRILSPSRMNSRWVRLTFRLCREMTVSREFWYYNDRQQNGSVASAFWESLSTI